LAHRYQALALTLRLRTGPNRPLLLALVFSYRLRFYIAGLVPNQMLCKFLKTKIRWSRQAIASVTRCHRSRAGCHRRSGKQNLPRRHGDTEKGRTGER